MKRHEFDRWLSDYVSKFPSTGIWLAELGDAISDSQRVLWADILEPYSLAEGKRATLAMARGEYPPVGSTNADREQTALKVRDVIRSMQRQDAEPAAVHPDDDYTRGVRPSRRALQGGVLQRAIEMKAAGKTPAEIAAALFGPPDPHERQITYRCGACRDRGWRTVWHYQAMQAYLAGQINPEGPYGKNYTMVVPCNCAAGEARCRPDGETTDRRKRNQSPPRSAMFDLEKYCPVSFAGVTDPESVRTFMEWCDNYFKERERERLARLEYEQKEF